MEDGKETTDGIISGIQPPAHWELVNDETHTSIYNETKSANAIKKTANENIPFVTHKLEFFVERIFKNFNVAVAETYLSLDGDAAFHVIFLVSAADYSSPVMQAVKIYTREFFMVNEGVDVRTTYMIDQEYLKTHFTAHLHKLKYRYCALSTTETPLHDTRNSVYRHPNMLPKLHSLYGVY
jgi:hypothetical protein